MSWRNNITPKRSLIEAAFGCCLFLIFGILGLLNSYSKINHPLTRKDLITLTDIIINKPEIKSGGKSGGHIDLFLPIRRNFIFQLKGYPFVETRKKDFINKVRQNDTIQIEILKSEYRKKIECTQDLKFTDRFNWKWIQIQEIRKGKEVFLKFEDHINKQTDDAGDIIFLYVFLLLIGPFWLFFEYRIYKKATSNSA